MKPFLKRVDAFSEPQSQATPRIQAVQQSKNPFEDRPYFFRRTVRTARACGALSR